MAEPQVLQRAPATDPSMRSTNVIGEPPVSTHPAAKLPQTQDQTESFGTGYQYRRALELIANAKDSILSALSGGPPGRLGIAHGSDRIAPIVLRLPRRADANDPFVDPETTADRSEDEPSTVQTVEITLSARSQAILETKRRALAPHAAALQLLESLGESACDGLSQDQKAALLELARSRFNDPSVQLRLSEWQADPRSALPPIEVQLGHTFPALAEVRNSIPHSLLDSYLAEQFSGTETPAPNQTPSVDPLVLERFDTLRTNLRESGLHQLELSLSILAERSYAQRNPESEILRDLQIAEQILEAELTRLLPGEARQPERNPRKLELFGTRPDLRMLCSVEALDQTCFSDLPNLAYSYDRHIETDPRAEDGTLRLNLHTWTNRQLSSIEQVPQAVARAVTDRLSARDMELLEARSRYECYKTLEATLSWQADPQTRDEPIEHFVHRARWGQPEPTVRQPDTELFSPRISALYAELKAQLHPVLERQCLLTETKRILDPFSSTTQYEVRDQLKELTARAQARFTEAIARSSGDPVAYGGPVASGDPRAVLPELMPGFRQLSFAPLEDFLERLGVSEPHEQSNTDTANTPEPVLTRLPTPLRTAYQEIGLIQSLDQALESLRRHSEDSPEFRIAETVNAVATAERLFADRCNETLAELDHHRSDLAHARTTLTESRSAALARLNATLGGISFGELPWLSNQLDSASGDVELDQSVIAELRLRLSSAAPLTHQPASLLAGGRTTPFSIEPRLDALILPAINIDRTRPEMNDEQPSARSLPSLSRSEIDTARLLATAPVSSKESVVPAFAHFAALQELQRLHRGLSELSKADRITMRNENLSEAEVFRRKLTELPSALYQVQTSALGFNQDERSERRAIPGIVVQQDALTLLEESRNELYRLSNTSEAQAGSATHRNQATEILATTIEQLSTALEVWQRRLDADTRAKLTTEWREIVQPNEYQREMSALFEQFLKTSP